MSENITIESLEKDFTNLRVNLEKFFKKTEQGEKITLPELESLIKQINSTDDTIYGIIIGISFKINNKANKIKEEREKLDEFRKVFNTLIKNQFGDD